MKNVISAKTAINSYIILFFFSYYVFYEFSEQRYIFAFSLCVVIPLVSVALAYIIPSFSRSAAFDVFLYLLALSALAEYHLSGSGVMAPPIAAIAMVALFMFPEIGFERPVLRDVLFFAVVFMMSVIGYGVILDNQNIIYIIRTVGTRDIWISSLTYIVLGLGIISYYLYWREKFLPVGRPAGVVIAAFAIGAVSILIFPTNLSTEYYHQHPVIEPAYQVMRSGGVLFQTAFSQYGQGPVAVSILSDGIFDLQLIESSNAAWQIIATIMLGLLALMVVLQDQKPSPAATALASIVLIACGLAFFGRRQSDYPSLLVYRFLLPVLLSFILCTVRNRRVSDIAAGAIIGVAPFWSVDSTLLVAVVLTCHLGWLFVEGRSSLLSLLKRLVASAIAAILAFALGMAVLYVWTGGIPRLGINYEIIDGYRVTGAWVLKNVDVLVRGVYLYAAVPVSIYAVYMFWLLVRRVWQPAAHAASWMPPPALHHLVVLTALASLGFIGRPVKWVIGTVLIFTSFGLLSFILSAARLARERGSVAEKLATWVVMVGLVGTCAAAVDLTYGPGSVSKFDKWSPVFLSLSQGQLPRIHAASTVETQLTEGRDTGAESVVARYLEQGRTVEIVADNWRLPGSLRLKYDLSSQLDVSTLLSDGMSVTRVSEILDDAEEIEPGTIILYMGLVVTKRPVPLVPNRKMLGYRILHRLRDQDRICLLEKYRAAYIYEVRLPGAACAPVKTSIEVPVARY